MVKKYQKENSTNLDVDRLKTNSRAKHLILSDYLPTWAGILSKWHKKLNYFDCFAGPGEYLWNGTIVDGSPIISIREISDLLNSNWPNKPDRVNMAFLEADTNQISKLEKKIRSIHNIPSELKVSVILAESEILIEKTLEKIETLAPSFFFIDPYGHPFSLELMKKVMERSKTEIMVNFMYYQIIRDIGNPQERERVLKLFAPDDPEKLDLKGLDGKFSQDKMLAYLSKRIGAKYCIPFRVNFGPDEKVSSQRTKYYLIHYSNDFKAFNLMLDIMWKNSDDNRPLEIGDGQPILFPLKGITTLKSKLIKKYQSDKKQIKFNALVEKNWAWYYKEKHYREVLKEFEKAGVIKVARITSKSIRGLSGDDMITFN